jgi:MFS family permease
MSFLERWPNQYPRQIWLLSGGMLVSATGGSMVWPFMTIYVRQQFEASLTTVALMLTLNSAAGLATTFLAGPVADRFGRRGVMVLSLCASSVVYACMIWAGSLSIWALLMVLSGAFGPFFRVGGNAMVADLVGPARRPGAYALLRTSNNLGIAIGPAVGGFIATRSYAATFCIAALASALFAGMILLRVTETLPDLRDAAASSPADAGYGHLLRDGPFLAYCGVSVLAVIPASMMFVLLPVYAKEQFGVAESQYGFIMTTNAGMVVLLQYAVTRLTQRYSHLHMLAVGALFYSIGVGSVAWGHSVYAFVLSMIILTVGEMVLVPTGTSLAANLSPARMRGRYMGVYGLNWGLGVGIGPVVGGYLNDNVAPVAIWYGGLVIGLSSVIGYLLLTRFLREPDR